jgi:hypothetical protein
LVLISDAGQDEPRLRRGNGLLAELRTRVAIDDQRRQALVFPDEWRVLAARVRGRGVEDEDDAGDARGLERIEPRKGCKRGPGPLVVTGLRDRVAGVVAVRQQRVERARGQWRDRCVHQDDASGDTAGHRRE